MADEPEWYEKILELQLAENPDVWARMQAGGLDEQQLRLGFIYLAPGEPEAQELATFLRDETDYDVEVHEQKASAATVASWLVVGATQPALVTAGVLDEWVQWMVAAGAAEGPCAFDGWEAQSVGPDLADERTA